MLKTPKKQSQRQGFRKYFGLEELATTQAFKVWAFSIESKSQRGASQRQEGANAPPRPP